MEECAPIRTTKEQWGILGNFAPTPFVIDGAPTLGVWSKMERHMSAAIFWEDCLWSFTTMANWNIASLMMPSISSNILNN